MRGRRVCAAVSLRHWDADSEQHGERNSLSRSHSHSIAHGDPDLNAEHHCNRLSLPGRHVESNSVGVAADDPIADALAHCDVHGERIAVSHAAANAVEYWQWDGDASYNAEPGGDAVLVSHAQRHVEWVEQPHALAFPYAYSKQLGERHCLRCGYPKSVADVVPDRLAKQHC